MSFIQKGEKECVSIEAQEDVADIVGVVVKNKRLHLFIENNSFTV